MNQFIHPSIHIDQVLPMCQALWEWKTQVSIEQYFPQASICLLEGEVRLVERKQQALKCGYNQLWKVLKNTCQTLQLAWKFVQGGHTRPETCMMGKTLPVGPREKRGILQESKWHTWRHGHMKRHRAFCRKYQITYNTWRVQIKLHFRQKPLWALLETDSIKGSQSLANGFKILHLLYLV